jgi:hypothetical protein
MKKLLLLLVLFGFTGIAAANSTKSIQINVAGSGGVLAGSNAGLSLTGDVLDDLGGTLGSLGTITLTTGKLISGDLGHGGMFAKGGAFTITGNGTSGVHDGVLFTGIFDSLQWKLVTASNGDHFYTLIGSFEGTWFTGQKAVGAFALLTDNTKLFDGSVNVASSKANVDLAASPVPEPTTLMLCGTGIASVVLAKFRARRNVKSARVFNDSFQLPAPEA